MFGIFWGTCSIVLLFAFGTGITEAQLKSMRGMGENIAIFWPGRTSIEYKGLPKGRRIWATEKDITAIKERAQFINRISPEFSRWNISIKRGNYQTLRQIVGVWPEFGPMRNVNPRWGSRFINDRDMTELRRVIVIGNLMAEDIFKDEDPVGQQILVNGMPFTVVGVMKEKDQDSSYSGRDSRKGFIPASTFQTMWSHRYPNNFVVQCDPQAGMEPAKREIMEIMGARYKFDPSDPEALADWDTTRGYAFLKTFFSAFKWFLVGIGVATLITGGIGVTNIMNVVLEERTKEIGIKMALGARKSHVLMQFILETLLLTSLGGVLGFGFATLIVTVVPNFGLEDYIGIPRVDMWAGIFVTIILTLVGLAAGIFPARRAANLQPVQALKLF